MESICSKRGQKLTEGFGLDANIHAYRLPNNYILKMCIYRVLVKNITSI